MIRSGLLDRAEGVEHGFFTREGGFSQGLYASLNCGFGSDDEAEIVTRNRKLVSELMNVEADKLLTVHQYHSAEVLVIETTHDVTAPPKADAMVTKVPGLALGVLTADCVPVLFADAEAGIIGAAHAGWKGAVAGVCEATIDAMEKLGAKREAIMASIGPSISQSSYEVGPEFRAQFRAADAEAFFIAATRPEHFMFDLKGFVAQILKRAGVGQVDILPHCTYAQAEKFFSYRRTTHAQEADYGRQISAISLVA